MYLWPIAPQYWICLMLGQCYGVSLLRGPSVALCQVQLWLCTAQWWPPRASMVLPVQLGGMDYRLHKGIGKHIAAMSIHKICVFIDRDGLV